MSEKTIDKKTEKLLEIVTIISLIFWIVIGSFLLSLPLFDIYVRDIGGGGVEINIGKSAIIAVCGFMIDVVTLTWAWIAIEKNNENMSRILIYISIGLIGIPQLALVLFIIWRNI